MVTGSAVEYNLGDGREECEERSGFDGRRTALALV